MGVLGVAHIISLQATGTPENLAFFSSALRIPLMLFGEDFADRLKSVLYSLRSCNQPFNLILLNPYVHKLFDDGYAGLRPSKITQNENRHKRKKYRVHFAIHWFVRTEITRGRDLFLAISTMREMNRPRVEHVANADRFQDSYALSNAPVREGDMFSISIHDLEEAENMFAMLQLRWAMAMVQYLSGSAGMFNEFYYNDDNRALDELM